MLCEYGCNRIAKFQIGKKKKWCCSENYNQCPVKRKKSAKGRQYEPKKINDGRICDFGCNNVAHYEHKNGSVSCEKILQKCYGNRIKTSKTKLNSNGPKEYTGVEKCDYGCNKQALYLFENGKKCCSANPGKCENILLSKWNRFEEKYGVRNPMLLDSIIKNKIKIETRH